MKDATGGSKLDSDSLSSTYLRRTCNLISKSNNSKLVLSITFLSYSINKTVRTKLADFIQSPFIYDPL